MKMTFFNSRLKGAQHRASIESRGESRISEKGVRMYKGMGVRFGDVISIFL